MNSFHLTAPLAVAIIILLVCVIIPSSSKAQKDDCAPDTTEDNQVKLRIHYPSLYTDFVNNEQFGDRGPGMKPGTVIFINAQDKQLRLKCPCDGLEYSWTLYERAGLADEYDSTYQSPGIKFDKIEKDNDISFKRSKDFNEAQYSLKKIRPRAPSWRKYFNTYECSNSTHKHYFNVFTRPLPRTTFPIQWIEGAYDDDVGFDCTISGYRHDIFQQDPYTFSWKLPATASDNITINIDDANPEFIYNELKFTYDNSTSPPRSKVIAIGNEVHLNMSGIFECIIVDKNNLSSSFGGLHII